MTDYEPLEWQRSLGYRVDETRCRASVHESGNSVGFHQCSRKPKAGGRYCSTHTPEAIAARRKSSEERYRKSEALNAARQMRWHGKPLIEALRKIAAGHNDPRGLAEEVLAEHGLADPIHSGEQ